MINFQQTRRRRNILHSKPVLAFLFILVLVFAWGMIGFFGKMRLTKGNRELAETKVAELGKEKQKLSADIARLETESGVEENIRQKFGLAKQGEGLIVVVDDKNPPKVVEKEKSFFSFLFFWSWLK